MSKKQPQAPITTTLGGAAEDAKSCLEELRDELQDWYDNLPEQFQVGEKGEELTEALDAIGCVSFPAMR